MRAGLLVSMIAIDSDSIGDTFEVSLSVSAILLGGSIAIAIGDTFFRLYRCRLSRYF
jgi:hypothetical protein